MKIPFLRRDNDGRVATIKEAQKILGRHVCTCREVFAKRGENISFVAPPLFLIETLRECAYQNRQKLANWWLVYVIGLSLYRLHSDPQTKHHFFSLPLLWEEAEREKTRNPSGPDYGWVKNSTHSGYWLINFKPNFCNKTVDVQRRDLVGFGPEFERVPENVFAAALFSIFDCKGVRLCENLFHRGENARLGYFGDKGLIIFYPEIKHICRKDTGVMICVNPHKQTLKMEDLK